MGDGEAYIVNQSELWVKRQLFISTMKYLKYSDLYREHRACTSVTKALLLNDAHLCWI